MSDTATLRHLPAIRFSILLALVFPIQPLILRSQEQNNCPINGTSLSKSPIPEITVAKRLSRSTVRHHRAGSAKPSRVLCGYEKTDTLAPGKSQVMTISVSNAQIASYDDSGWVTGHAHCFVLEEGTYRFYAGSDVRSAKEFYHCPQNSTEVISRHEQALAHLWNHFGPYPSGDLRGPLCDPHGKCSTFSCG